MVPTHMCSCLAGAVLLCAAPARAQVPCEAAKLLASDPDDDDRFGQAVSLDGEVALVGAFKHDDQGLNSGSAYVFRFDGATWVFEQELVALDGGSSDRFGWSVAVSGNVAVIGALEDDDLGSNAGAAYVFRFNGVSWMQKQKLTASDGFAGDEFGTFVAIDGDLAAIGANQDDDGGAESGSAYVFRFDGVSWSQEQKLVAAGDQAGDSFGTSVAVAGERVVVGAPLEDQAGSASGAAYVFAFDGTSWGQEVKFLPSGLTSNDRFGYSVGIDGTGALVGAFNDSPSGPTSGSAFVFRRVGTSWSEEQKLIASDGAVADAFGWSVSIEGDVVVVAARLEDSGGLDSGAAYVYRRDPDSGLWGDEGKFVGGDSAANDSFAYSLSLSQDRVLCGAWADDDNGFDESGSAYVFLGTAGVDCDANGVADTCDVLAGVSDADGNGVLDVCEGGPRFCDASDGSLASCPCGNAGGAATGCDLAQGTGGVDLTLLRQETSPLNRATVQGTGYSPMGAPAVVVIRATGVDAGAPVVFGDGLRCVAVPLVRLGATVANGGVSRHTFGHGSGAGLGSFAYQLWFRSTPISFCDPAAAFNLSGGRMLVWQ